MKKAAVILSGVLASCSLLTGCEQPISPKTAETPQNERTSHPTEKSVAVRDFPAQPTDARDIATLEDFQQRLAAVHQELSSELQQLQQKGELTPEFTLNRQRDHAQSALKMLQGLELSTEQGRYIQGLLYQHWEQQAKNLKSSATETSASAPTATDSNEQQLAEAQLQHWKAQQNKAP